MTPLSMWYLPYLTYLTKAKTIPIIQTALTSNYHPITLSNLNKILEINFNQIYKFIEQHKCIYVDSGRNTTNQALIKITETIRKSLDKEDYDCGIFIEPTKGL